jgi:hypothetical protein
MKSAPIVTSHRDHARRRSHSSDTRIDLSAEPQSGYQLDWAQQFGLDCRRLFRGRSLYQGRIHYSCSDAGPDFLTIAVVARSSARAATMDAEPIRNSGR